MLEEFNRRNYWVAFLAFSLIIISVFHQLGLVPLYLEEPRRALIALEMIFNDNFWVPTEFGEFYYKKPPFYNWILLLAFKIFGDFNEWTVRFFSIVSYIGMAITTYLLCRKYLSITFGIYAALLFLVSTDLYFYFTITAGEIDLFYSFITFLIFAVAIHFGIENKWLHLFVLTYLLSVIGFLTKGIPSLVFQGITLTTLAVYTGQWKKLFSYQHIIGFLPFLFLLLGYTLKYNQTNDILGYFSSESSLLSQTTERTVLAHNLPNTFFGMLIFPLLLFKILAPGSLLVFFGIKKEARNMIAKNQFLMICLFVLLANVLVYWISPGTRSRYLYMFFPLVSVLLIGLIYQLKCTDLFLKRWDNIQKIVFIIFIIIFGSLPFIKELNVIDNIIWVSSFSIASIAILFLWHYRQPKFRFIIIIFTIILLRFVFNLTILPIRAESGNKAEAKRVAFEVLEVVKNRPLYMYPNSRISRTSIYYLERETHKVIRFEKANEEGFYLIKDQYLNELGSLVVYLTFEYNEESFSLIEVKKD